MTFGMVAATDAIVALCMVPSLPLIEPAAWQFNAASVVIHLGYYACLLKAYSHGDLSHTYRVARGLGPLLVALASGQVTDEKLRSQDLVEVLLPSCGLIAIALPSLRSAPWPARYRRAT